MNADLFRVEGLNGEVHMGVDWEGSTFGGDEIQLYL